MDPVTLATIGIPALFNLGKSVFGGAQLARNKRPTAPTYEIPTAVSDYMRRRNLMAQQDLPGRQMMEEQIGGQVAGAIGDVNRAASSSAAALGAVTNINQRAVDAVRDLGIKAAEYRSGMQERAAEANKYLADYQEKSWEYNQNIPYQQKMNEYMATKQAGNANLWGGLEGIGSSVVQGLGSMQRDQQWQALIDAIKGGGATGTTGDVFRDAANTFGGGTLLDRVAMGDLSQVKGFAGATSLKDFPSYGAWRFNNRRNK